MTIRSATRQARAEISHPYRVAGSLRSGTTWGVTIQTGKRSAWQCGIGTYAEAVTARAEWIADRVTLLTAA